VSDSDDTGCLWLVIILLVFAVCYNEDKINNLEKNNVKENTQIKKVK